MVAKPILLCIDDETTGLMFRRLVLESAGYQVRTASSGLEGLELLRKERIDAVVLDYYMPGLNGGQVARRIRQVRPRVPILLLSAYVFLPEEVLLLVDAHVTKGQPVSLLLAELDDLLRMGYHSHPELRGEHVAYVDQDRHYIDASDGFCRLVGYSREELFAKTIDDLIAPEMVPERFRSSVADGKQEGRDVLRHRNGALIPIRFRAMVFPDGCMASVIDPIVDQPDSGQEGMISCELS